MRHFVSLLALFVGLCIAAQARSATPLPAPDGQARSAPAPGSSRAGVSYDVTIHARDGAVIAFTVHEPLQMVGGKTYPLLMTGPGFGMPRVNSLMRELVAPPGTPLADTFTTKQYTDAGYVVVAFDQRGFGQSGGQVSIMDPDQDGDSLVRIVDWAEANLPYLMRRDGNLVLGTYGASYGGGFQLLLNNVDPRRRLDAMIPSITWNDLGYSLNPGAVPKSAYALALILAGEASSRLNSDPRVRDLAAHGLLDGRFTDADNAMLRYHSNRYFCDGVSQPGKRIATHPPKVDALFLQGMFDVIFNLNEGLDNAQCLRETGGDVRLIGYNVGHVLPSGTGLVIDGIGSPGDFSRCGPHVADAVSRTWFDAKLKRDPAAITALGRVPRNCITIASNGEGVVVDAVKVGGTKAMVPKTLVPSLSPLPLSVPLYRATAPTVVAGIPTATVVIANPLPLPGLPGGLPLGVGSDDAMIFVAIARSRQGLPSQLEILNDQVRPLRGFGTHVLELNGIGTKLAAGDQLHLLISASSLPQFPIEIARNPLLLAVSVSGSVQLPVLGNVATVR
ncbi:MAG: hypothetical protein K0Q76_2705 [Panacagrimonas sp.]|nr:CocE/NonD family hydrolase [Panacagrimonas sp.]MCC2657597.1 hypothetical protein [Panacagrimonas sp.]